MSDLLVHNESSKPPSVFKQLQSLASTISSETKRLQGIIISVGEHPHLYDGAANKLIDEVSKLKKEATVLDPQASNVEFSTFISSARQQLIQHQRHADRIQLYIEKYGYKVPAHTHNGTDTAGAASTSPSLDDGTLYNDLLCELLSPELSASSQQLTAPERYGRHKSFHTDLMPPSQSTEAPNAGLKDSSRTSSLGTVCSGPRASSPPTRTACSPVFKIPIIKIRKPTESESLGSSSSAERPTHGDDVTLPDACEPFKGQQTVFKSLSSYIAKSGVRKSVSSSALAQPKYDAVFKTRHDGLIHRSRRPPTTTSPCVGHRVASGGARSVAADRCFATPNTKQSVEVWLQSVRTKQTPVCSPSPLQFHLPKRQINNPMLENLPSRRTPLRTAVKLQVSSASPDFSSRKPIQRTLATEDLSLRNSPSPKSFGSDHQIETPGTIPGTNQPISERVKDEKVEASSSVFSRFTKADEDVMLDCSLEEPVLSETTMNLLAEMAKARAAEVLNANSSFHTHPPLAKASSVVTRPVPHHKAVPSRSLTCDATDQAIEYPFKIPGLPSQANLPASNKLPEACVRSTQAEMIADLSTKYDAANGNSHLKYGSKTFNESAVYSDYSKNKFSEVHVKVEFNSPEEPVLCSDYSKHFETENVGKEINTPEEPILFSDRACCATDLDTPEEPVLLSCYSKQKYGTTNVQEVDTPEEPKLNIKYQQQEHSHGLPDTPEEPTLSIHGQRAVMASRNRTGTEPPARNNLIFETTASGNSHAYKQSVDVKTFFTGHNLLSSHKPNLLPPCVQQLLDAADFVDKSPELSNASKRMMLDRRQNHAADGLHSDSVKDKYDFTREKENIPLSSSVYQQKSSPTGSALIDKRLYVTDDTKRASGRPKPVFEDETLERELDMSSLKIGTGNDSIWNNSSLLHDQSGQSRRVAPNQSFSQAMLQYSHVKASPMPPHHPTKP